MLELTDKVFRLAPPGGLFDDAVISNLFPETEVGARRALVHRAIRKGEVLRIRPGLFCLTDVYRKSHPHVFALAQLLHYPSHISLETALSYHGLIPEAVFQVASVTTERSRVFRTPFGTFSFKRVPSNSPRAGVRLTKIDDDNWAFMATPIRAISDVVYLRSGISWKRHGIGFLVDSMRIDMDDLAEVDMEDFDEVLSAIRNQRTRSYLSGLLDEIA